MNEEDIGLIKIPLETFKKIYELNKDNNDDDNNISKKATELVENYICFSHSYDAKRLWEKKKIIAGIKKQKTRQRPHILLSDFTDESKCKKEFTSYLNKLTDINKDNIYLKINNFLLNINKKFINILFEILWNFIKISSNNIYIDVIYIFDKIIINENLNRLWENYINNEEWLPPLDILNNTLLFDDNNYDEYCKYVKWKKNNISLSRAWCNILKKENKLLYIEIIIDKLITKINIYINIKNKKHIIDLILDQLNIYLDICPLINTINKLKDLNLDLFEKSSKFKIINIIDKFK